MHKQNIIQSPKRPPPNQPTLIPLQCETEIRDQLNIYKKMYFEKFIRAADYLD